MSRWPHGIPVDARGIDPADRLDPEGQRFLEQVRGARVGEQAVLGKRDLVDVTRPSSRYAAARTASTARSPTSGSMSVWLRT